MKSTGNSTQRSKQKKDRSLLYSVILYVLLCLYAYYYKIYEIPMLPDPTNDVDWRVRGMIYPLSFIGNFFLALFFFVALKLIRFISHLKKHRFN
jgi:hypothetical protein